MAKTYVIGDVQGCFRTLTALLDTLNFDAARDALWLVGDVVNRGPDSLKVLRFIIEHKDVVRMVLGNHDFALLARAWQLRAPKALDTLDEVLAAPDKDALLAYLRVQPLLYENDAFAMLHAGITPAFSLDTTRALARAIEAELKDEARAKALVACALGKAAAPSEDVAALGRGLRMLVNLRALDAHHAPDYSFKGALNALGEHRSPWFAHLKKSAWPKHLLVGHWAALGLYQNEHFTALDSGCVWGGSLSALCLEDGRVTSIPTQELAPLQPDED